MYLIKEFWPVVLGLGVTLFALYFFLLLHPMPQRREWRRLMNKDNADFPAGVDADVIVAKIEELRDNPPLLKQYIDHMREQHNIGLRISHEKKETQRLGAVIEKQRRMVESLEITIKGRILSYDLAELDKVRERESEYQATAHDTRIAQEKLKQDEIRAKRTRLQQDHENEFRSRILKDLEAPFKEQMELQRIVREWEAFIDKDSPPDKDAEPNRRLKALLHQLVMSYKHKRGWI
jgi:hypothetical protein